MVGPAIRELRQAVKLDLRTLAARVGVSHTAAWAWESGVRRPTGPHLSALLRVLADEAKGAKDG